MEEKLRLSVIIPAYNAEKYLGECLDCMPGSTELSYEILIVNDGSTDKTEEVVCSYQKKNSHIKYIEQENAGVSAARNHGLKSANGRFVMFVDADDKVDTKVFLECLKYLEDAEEELLIYDYFAIDEKSHFLEKYDLHIEMQDLYAINKQFITTFYLNACWGKVYRLDKIRQLQLEFDPTMKVGEDLVFVGRYLMEVQKAVAMKGYLYGYRQTMDNTMNTRRQQITEQTVKDQEKMIALKIEFLEKRFSKKEEWQWYYAKEAEVIIANINIALQAERCYKDIRKDILMLLKNKNVKLILHRAAKVQGLKRNRKMAIRWLQHSIMRYLYMQSKYRKYHSK